MSEALPSSSQSVTSYLSSLPLLPENYGEKELNPPRTVAEKLFHALKEKNIRYQYVLPTVNECDENGKTLTFSSLLTGRIVLWCSISTGPFIFDQFNAPTSESTARLAFCPDEGPFNIHNSSIQLSEYDGEKMKFISVIASTGDSNTEGEADSEGDDQQNDENKSDDDGESEQQLFPNDMINYLAFEKSRRTPYHLYAASDWYDSSTNLYRSLIRVFNFGTLNLVKEYELKWPVPSKEFYQNRILMKCHYLSSLEFSRTFPPSFLTARYSSIYLIDIASSAIKRFALRLKTKSELLANVSDQNEVRNLLPVYEKLTEKFQCVVSSSKCRNWDCFKCRPLIETIIRVVDQLIPSETATLRSQAALMMQFLKIDIIGESEKPMIQLDYRSLHIDTIVHSNSSSAAPSQTVFLLADGVLFILDDALSLRSLILLNKIPLDLPITSVNASVTSTITPTNTRYFEPSCMCMLTDDSFVISERYGIMKFFKKCSSHRSSSSESKKAASESFEYECIQTIFAYPSLFLTNRGGIIRIVAHLGRLFIKDLSTNAIYIIE